jgi:uncharacterized protein (TIGR00251 family)
VFYKEDGNFIILKIKAQPQSHKSQICGLYGEDAIKVKISAPAVEGAANKELIKFLSKRFKVAKSDITLLSGQSSKIKSIKLPKSQKLQEFIKEIESGR